MRCRVRLSRWEGLLATSAGMRFEVRRGLPVAGGLCSVAKTHLLLAFGRGIVQIEVLRSVIYRSINHGGLLFVRIVLNGCKYTCKKEV
ncbi:hypothetical protein TSAR_010513 [Trichomalopsis sarcophagae]|uniref:Uncharacterized protein n=1 Tax=Trichomalopsis sarcophagae TaxID=543379 RepID=A0A232F5N2_9HYME|nr:hypothetical protein TSAR_010513 [Trichomalopsis sarcophagae]